jgi:hypothetical protein
MIRQLKLLKKGGDISFTDYLKHKINQDMG